MMLPNLSRAVITDACHHAWLCGALNYLWVPHQASWNS
jgi:hypothetical protein